MKYFAFDAVWTLAHIYNASVHNRTVSTVTAIEISIHSFIYSFIHLLIHSLILFLNPFHYFSDIFWLCCSSWHFHLWDDSELKLSIIFSLFICDLAKCIFLTQGPISFESSGCRRLHLLGISQYRNYKGKDKDQCCLLIWQTNVLWVFPKCLYF